MSKVEMGANGGFIVNGGTEVSLGTLLMQLNIDRTKTLDSQIADQMSEIQDRNETLRAMNELLAWMRNARENKSQSNDDEGSSATFGVGIMDANGNEIKKTTEGWFAEFGMGTPTDVNPNDDKDEWQSEWDANIETVKGKIDTLNSDSQLDMIRLQSLIDKRSVAFETASKHQDREYQDKSKINQKG